jgi:hypothetical protein
MKFLFTFRNERAKELTVNKWIGQFIGGKELGQRSAGESDFAKASSDLFQRSFSEVELSCAHVLS